MSLAMRGFFIAPNQRTRVRIFTRAFRSVSLRQGGGFHRSALGRPRLREQAHTTER